MPYNIGKGILLFKGGMTMKRQLRVAILGQGRSGRDIHGANLINMQDLYKIAAVVDPLEERRQRAQREYGCDVYDNYSHLLKRDDYEDDIADLLIMCVS
jgi:predicted dehydrogenase